MSSRLLKPEHTMISLQKRSAFYWAIASLCRMVPVVIAEEIHLFRTRCRGTSISNIEACSYYLFIHIRLQDLEVGTDLHGHENSTRICSSDLEPPYSSEWIPGSWFCSTECHGVVEMLLRGVSVSVTGRIVNIRCIVREYQPQVTILELEGFSEKALNIDT